MGDAKHLVEELMKGASVREVLESSKAVPRFPEKIFIVVYPSTNIGYVYEKTYEHEGGGCYYRSKENTSPVDGDFISLYHDGRLTYLWNGIEKDYNKEWFVVNGD